MNIVITGANRGLGLELARVYARRGDTVIAGCRNPLGAGALDAITSHVYGADMADEASVASFAAAAAAVGPIDVLINNAGTDATAFGVPAAERDVMLLTGEHFLAEMQINAVSPMMLARALVPSLAASGRGRIVNVSSQVGSMEVARRMGSDVGYCASKAALNMITVKQSIKLAAQGIVSIAMHPGYLRTDMGGPNADLDPAETAGAIVALIDGLTPDQSGQFLRWDGSIHPW